MANDNLILFDSNGIPAPVTEQPFDDDCVVVATSDLGRRRIPRRDIFKSQDGRHAAKQPFADYPEVADEMNARSPEERARGTVEHRVIPVHQEVPVVETRSVETGVRVRKSVHEAEQTVPTETSHEEVTVERIAVDREVDELPKVREEGDTTIIPVVEEIAVVVKRYLIKEEVRVTKVRRVERRQEVVTLRREHAEVEPIGENPVGSPRADHP